MVPNQVHIAFGIRGSFDADLQRLGVAGGTLGGHKSNYSDEDNSSRGL